MSRWSKKYHPKLILDPRVMAEINAEVEKEWNRLPKEERVRLTVEEQTRSAVWLHSLDEQKLRSIRNEAEVDKLVETARTVIQAHFARDSELAGTRATKPTSAVAHAESILTWFEAIFSKRVRGEEIGDALELIHRFEGRRLARALICTKVVTTVFWLIINSIRECASSLLGKKAE